MTPLIVTGEGPATQRVRTSVVDERFTAPAKVRVWPSIALMRRRSPPALVNAPEIVIGKVPPTVAGSAPKVTGVVMTSAPVRAKSARNTPPLKLNTDVEPNCETPEFLLKTSVPCDRVVDEV